MADLLLLIKIALWIIIWWTNFNRAFRAKAYTSLTEFNLTVLSYIHQSTKLTSLPIFHAIQHIIHIHVGGQSKVWWYDAKYFMSAIDTLNIN